MNHEPDFDESSVQSHHGLDDLEIALPANAPAVIEQARANALAGVPGELRMQVQIKRADGRVEQHTLIGTVDGLA